MSRTVMFKYYFRFDVAGTWHYYYVDGSGDVQDTTTKTALVFAPKGWEKKALKWERGFIYHGVFQTFSIPLEFVEDAATILRYLYVNYGTEGKCEFYIERNGNTAANPYYDPYYYGDIDFSRYSDKEDFVVAEVMEGGFMAKLKAKENTNIEIDVNDSPDRVWVNMDGLEVIALFRFSGVEQPVDNVTSPTYVEVQDVNMPTVFWFLTEGYSNGDINPKGNDFLGPFSNMWQEFNAGIISLSMGSKWFIHNTSDTISYNYRIYGKINIGTIAGPLSTKCRLRLLRFKKDTGTILQNHLLADGITYSGLTSGTEYIEFDSTIAVGPNECLIFNLFYTNPTVGSPHKTHIFSLEMNVQILNKVKQSYVACRRTFDVFNELVFNIDPTTLPVSTLLSTTQVTKVLSSGDALRGLEKAKLKTNVNDFYKSMNAVHNTCMKFDKPNNRIYIEAKAEAYDEATQIIDLGEVSNFVSYPLTEEMFSKLKIGFPDVKIDDVNGKDDVNILQEYQSPLIRVTNEKDLTSAYHSSMYEIEMQRANLTGKKLADAASDNEVFWIHIEDVPAGVIPAGLPGAGEDYYNLERGGYTVSQGLISIATAFNLYFSPKTSMFTHGNWINSMLYPQINLGGELTFQTSSKTQDNEEYLIWTVGPLTIYEKKTEALADLADPICYPIVFEVDTLIPQNILSILASNPYGKFKCKFKGRERYGFLLAASDEPATEPKQTYKLLCSISTDLENLIV